MTTEVLLRLSIFCLRMEVVIADFIILEKPLDAAAVYDVGSALDIIDKFTALSSITVTVSYFYAIHRVNQLC